MVLLLFYYYYYYYSQKKILASLQAPWESSMETYNHTGYTSDRGSPAWKHTFTQEDYRLCERENTHRPRLGHDFGGTGRG